MLAVTCDLWVQTRAAANNPEFADIAPNDALSNVGVAVETEDVSGAAGWHWGDGIATS